MKIILILLTLILPFHVQEKPAKIINSPLKDLAENITEGISNDSLKMVAIFNWVTENIEYDVELFNNGINYPEFNIDNNLDSEDFMMAYNEEVSKMVLDKKLGICDGYSRLVKSLCEYSGITCNVITGKVRQYLSKELLEHAWNAVNLNGKWYLMDVTWASGYVGLSGTKYTKKKNIFFFLTSPDLLIYDHLPDELEWTLLDTITANDLFYNSPIISTEPFQKGLTEYKPKNKIIYSDTINPIIISLEFNKKVPLYDISVRGWPSETLQDQLGIEVTRDNYDSLETIYPDLFVIIPKIEILDTKIIGNTVEYQIQPLNSGLKEIGLYIESSLPAMEYEINFSNH